MTRAEFVPVWVHRYREQGRLKPRVIAVEKAIKDYQLGLDEKLTYQDYRRLLEVWEETLFHLAGPGSPDILHI